VLPNDVVNDVAAGRLLDMDVGKSRGRGSSAFMGLNGIPGCIVQNAVNPYKL
jgi:hypothetical protein